MKARKLNETLIKFSNDDKSVKAERLALKVSKMFNTLGDICDNRSISAFPFDNIKEVIKLCNNLVKITEDVDIPKDYVEYVTNNKEALGYLESYKTLTDEKEQKIIEKRKKFREFKNILNKTLSDDVRNVN